MTHYIFYDFETTGLSHQYDQVLQFAAIVTDENFQELPDSSIDIRCRLLPHIVPSPTALVVTNVSPSLLLNQDMSHREFMHTIESWCQKWKPAVFLGYNSIGFDENMMRQGLYQSLHLPYLTNTSGNTRGDIMRLVHATYLFDQEAISIPIGPKGKPTFKLGLFAKANGIDFDDDEAHDALYDVRKTIEVAHLIKNKTPEIWDAMQSNTNKKVAIDFINDQDVFASGDVFFNKPFRWLMTACGSNNTNPAELGAFDLAHDPSEYLDLSVEQLIEVLEKTPKVIRTIRTNAQPFVILANKAATSYYDGITVSLELAQERAQIIKANFEFKARVGEALAARFEVQEESPHVEENIYGGFPSYADKNLMIKFHNATPEERGNLVGQFDDNRYKQLARRLVYFENPENLPENTKIEMDKWRAERLNDDNEVNQWRTIAKAQLELDELKKEHGENNSLIQEIDIFLKTMIDG